MLKLKNKRILFIALQGYSQGIKKKMEELGARVDYFNDKPNDGFICKACGRFKVKPYEYVLEKYYRKIINQIKKNKYDYILIIRGEYTPLKSVYLLKRTFPEAKMILYMWDSLRNNKGIEKKWHAYDQVYTFDRIDYLDHQEKIDFLPLYYYDDYVPSKKKKHSKYDIAFIGTGEEDRVKIIDDVKKQCDCTGKKIYAYIFLPHRLVYFYNKLLNKNYRNVAMNSIHFKKLPFEEVYKIYNSADCVIDVESAKQCGLTMRTIEMIGLRKKLITTNKDIVNYDFYNEDNICVVDRNNFVLDEAFLKRPYHDLKDEIYFKYSLSNWIMEVLK